MRIELPLPSWADITPRADDDAHTLTVAAPSPIEWAPWHWGSEPAPTLRLEVGAARPVTITITF
jgi:hypothetical protein